MAQVTLRFVLNVEFVDKLGDDTRLVVAMAFDMLKHVRVEEYDAALDILGKVVREHPTQLATLVQTWAVVYVEHSTGGQGLKGVPPKFVEVDVTNNEGGPLGARGLPAPVAWAGRILLAAANQDHAAFGRAFETLPIDTPDWPFYVMQVCDSVALTMNNFQRGYALAGRLE